MACGLAATALSLTITFRLTACAHCSLQIQLRKLCDAFLDQLKLDDHDLAEVASAIDQREYSYTSQRHTQLQRDLVDALTRLQRAPEQGLRQENSDLAEELFAHAREAKALLATREAELATLSANKSASPRAWLLAQRVDWIAQCIRATFKDWSRESQARVLAIALDDTVLGYVNRWSLGLWMRWQGDTQSRREIPVPLGKRQPWTSDEKATLHHYSPLLMWEALCLMVPRHTQSSNAAQGRSYQRSRLLSRETRW